MVCERRGEVTETFMTEGWGELLEACQRLCRKSRSPIRLDGLVGRKNLEMSPSIVSNGQGKQAQIGRRAGMAGSL
jgi:hypothetical protein